MKWPVMTPVEDVVELRQQRKDEALSEFEERRDWAEYNAALNAWNHGDVMRCRQSLERLLARNPQHVEAQELLATLETKPGATSQSDTSVQTASFDSPPQASFPDENTGKNAAGVTAYHRCSGSVRLARCAKVDGNTVLSDCAKLLAAGEKALMRGDCKAAQAFFRQAESAIPNDPQIPTLAAVSALELNRADVALDITRAAASRLPGSAALHRTMGVACYRCGDYKSSQVVLQQALSLDNMDPLTYFLQGCTLSKLGESEAAEAHFRKAATLDPRYARCRIGDK